MFAEQSPLKQVSRRRSRPRPIPDSFVHARIIQMIDARLELAPNSTMAPLRSQRLATTGVFVANGMGIGCWAAAIPRVKADLALSDATLSVALLSFAAGAIIAMPLMGLFAHRLRSGPASIVAGFGFAAALAVLGFARSDRKSVV